MRKAGRQSVFREPSAFELPENLRGPGRALLQAHALAIFAASCLRGSDFGDSPLILCLDSSAAVVKEYRHLPAKPGDLRKFAALEAETVLKDSPENYFIATREYHHAELSSGRLKSVLFAVQKELIVVDAGYENLRVVLFTNGEPVFMKEFDSVWPDILEMLHRDGGCSYEEAMREMKRPGFLLSAGNASFGESVTSLVNTLLETASAEVVRNMRVVLSAERLEPEQVIFCGALASHPDFERYFESLSLEIPYRNAEDVSKVYQLSVGVEAQAAALGSRSRDFFTLSGMLSSRGGIDFLEQEKERIGGRVANRAAVALLCAAAFGVMAIEPVLYSRAAAQQKADERALSAPQITEIRSLTSQRERLESQYQAIQNDEKLLPWQKSKMEEAVSNLQKQLVPKVRAVTTFQIDGSTGKVTVAFTADDMAQFNSARESIAGDGYFQVLVPFTLTKAGESGYQCSATLTIKNYQPASASSPKKGG